MSPLSPTPVRRASGAVLALLGGCLGAWAGIRVDPPAGAPPPAHAPEPPRQGLQEAAPELDRQILAGGGRWVPVVTDPARPAALLAGTRFRVCLTPREDGYITLRVRDSQSERLLYPAGTRTARPVSAGVRLCMGDEPDVELRVAKPYGRTLLLCLVSRAAGTGRGLARDGAVDCSIEFRAVAP